MKRELVFVLAIDTAIFGAVAVMGASRGSAAVKTAMIVSPLVLVATLFVIYRVSRRTYVAMARVPISLAILLTLFTLGAVSQTMRFVYSPGRLLGAQAAICVCIASYFWYAVLRLRRSRGTGPDPAERR
jgi:hypothetical protein